MEYIKGHRDIKEIPRSQRYADRPRLEMLFTEGIIKDRMKRNRIAKDAIERYGYTQKEVADFIGIHYSVVSRLLKKS
ncbi:MAG: hypothetical protein ACK415_12530 [Thermodesulfovibrionales bacterium]